MFVGAAQSGALRTFALAQRIVDDRGQPVARAQLACVQIGFSALPVVGMSRNEHKTRVGRGELSRIGKKHEQRNEFPGRAFNHRLLDAECAVILDTDRLGIERGTHDPVISDGLAKIFLEPGAFRVECRPVGDRPPFGIQCRVSRGHGRLNRIDRRLRIDRYIIHRRDRSPAAFAGNRPFCLAS